MKPIKNLVIIVNSLWSFSILKNLYANVHIEMTPLFAYICILIDLPLPPICKQNN